MPDSPYYTIAARMGAGNSYEQAATNLRLDLGLGLRIVNPWDIAYKYNEEQLIEHEGSAPIMDGKLAGRNIELIGGMGNDYPYDVGYDYAYIARFFKAFNEDDGSYLETKMWSSGGPNVFRYYSRFLNCEFPLAAGTQHRASEFIRLLFRMYDPGIHRDSGQNNNYVVTGGYLSTTINNSASLIDSTRVVVKIKKTTTDNPTNVGITIAGEVFTITDSLTGTNDYWFIDCCEGWVRLNSEDRDGGTDKIDKFSGKFHEIPDASSVSLIINDTASSDFEVEIRWLYRWI